MARALNSPLTLNDFKLLFITAQIGYLILKAARSQAKGECAMRKRFVMNDRAQKAN